MTLLSQLNTLESTGLVRLINAQPNVEYIFRHALIYDAVHNSIVKRDRIALHSLVGMTLERLYSDRVNSGELAPMLAQHFDLGGDDRRAVLYYTLAGDASFDTFANLEAIAHYSRAIDLAATAQISNFQLIHLYTRRGRAQELIGRYEQAVKNYQGMQAAARQRGDRSMELNALILEGTIRVAPTAVRNIDEGHSLSERALALARELNDRPAEAKILWNLMLLHRHAGDPKQARAYGEQSVVLARELNLREQLAFTLNDLQPLYMVLGQPTQSIDALHEAQQIWREDRNLPMLADGLATEAMMNFFIGEYDRSLALSAESQRLSESIGNLWNQSYSRFIRGYIFLERGEIDRAIETMETTIRLGEQAGFLFALIQTQADLGFVYSQLGDYPRAMDYARRSLTFAQTSFPQGASYPLSLMAYVNFLKGDVDQSQIYLHDAADAFTASEMNMMSFFGPLTEVEIAQAHGDYDRAVHIADRTLTSMNSWGMQPFRSDALYFKAQALWRQGQTDAAQQLLDQARQAAEKLGSRRSLWKIYTLLSEIERQQGNLVKAVQLKNEAEKIINHIADHISDLRLRESFLNLPDVRAALAKS